ncbi:MAG: endo-1,4-beta-xylanase, partial [Actinomycetes bacterium]
EPLGEISPAMDPGLVRVCPWGNGWDVNDSCPFTSKNFFYTTLGERYIDEALRAARAADPNAKLFINELLWNPKVGDPKADALLALVKRLKDEGVPLDGIGLELHGMLGVVEPEFPGTASELTNDAPTMAGLVDYINRLGKLGVKVEFTEVDLPIGPIKSSIWKIRRQLISDSSALDIQAKLFGRIGRSCAAAPACSGITVWGLTDPETWFAAGGDWRTFRPLLFDENFQPKPGYFKLRDGLLQRCPLRGTQPSRCSTPWTSPPAPTVAWSTNKATRTVTAGLTASGLATGYSLVAKSGSKRVEGRCAYIAAPAKTTCSVNLSSGRWSVAVTPSNSWSDGTAALETITISSG